MKRKHLIPRGRLLISGLCAGLAWTPAVLGQTIVQGLLGMTKLNEDETRFTEVDGLDPALEDQTDLSELITFGGAWQTVLNEDAVNLGLECGILFAIKTDGTNARSVNGSVGLSFDSSLLLGDLFGGGFLSVPLGSDARFYAGAGPLLMLGRAEGDYDQGQGFSRQETDTAVGFGGYVRAGVEMRMGGDFTEYLAGIGVRGFTASLDLDNTLGSVDMQGGQLFVSFTRRM